MNLPNFRHAAFRKVARTLTVGALMFALATPQSYAWGHQGHRITALVAEAYLTPSTKAAIAELLHGQKIADIASWADEIRGTHPEASPWHFVDIPSKYPSFDRMRDCPPSAQDPKSPWRDCITDRILYFEGRLGDESLPLEQRAEALKFVVHFIGDIHQPMHALDDARGGNGIIVNFMGNPTCGTYKCNLHGVWDYTMIEHEGISDEKYADRVLKEIKDNNWERLSGGDPTTWANVSHHYAINGLAPNGALLTHEYVAEQTKVIDAELGLGGLRLARVLNRILGTPTPADTSRPVLSPAPATVAAPPAAAVEPAKP